MNYCIVAFGVILFIAGFQWIFDGRKNFTGPKVDVHALRHGTVEAVVGAEVVEAEKAEQSGDSGSLSGKQE